MSNCSSAALQEFDAGEKLLNDLKRSRRSAAVLKMDLVNLRAHLPDSLIFAFEGIDDKGVYFNWIRRVCPDMDFEPFPCQGKSFVLELKRVIDRDLNDLGRGVYFFVDRDFDDLRGLSQDESIFMTDHYSIENYLVSGDVVDRALKDEFHCHARPEVRSKVAELFVRVFDEFLSVTSEVNFRLYCARRLGIELSAELPTKVGKLVAVRLDHVVLSADPVAEIVRLAREPAEEEKVGLREAFDALPRRERYRGKFSLMFLMKWLELLAEDRVSTPSENFADLPKNVRVRLQSLTPANLASKSELPEGLADFVRAMKVASCTSSLG